MVRHFGAVSDPASRETVAGLNLSLAAADMPDERLVELVEGAHPLQLGRALDLGYGGGCNTLYLARHGWGVVGIDTLGRAIDKGRSHAVGAAASARFIQGDVTRLSDLDIGDGYRLIVDQRVRARPPTERLRGRRG
jgi:SAM-dependent methyltransferase